MTPDNEYYNKSDSKKYHVVLNVINPNENITAENLKIVSLMPLNNEDIAELESLIHRKIIPELIFLGTVMVFPIVFLEFCMTFL